MMTGSYIGDGTDNREISGAGFTPAVVIVKMSDGGNEGQIRTSNMADGISKQMVGSSNAYEDRIQSFTGNGFIVGANNDVNRLGKTYYWTAFKSTAGLTLGSYTGDGNDDRNITGLGLDPVLVIVIPLEDRKVIWRSSSFVGDKTAFFGAASNLGNTIQALIPGGFQVGDESRANKDGYHYLYLAFKASSGISIGKYEGTGVNNTVINGVGFRPEYLFIKSDATNRAVQKSNKMPDVATVEFDNSREDDNRIHNLNNDGFVLGTQQQVNNVHNDYYYVAFRNSPEEQPALPCIAVGSYIGDGTANRVITGVGFQPDVLIVKGDFGQEAQIRTNEMPDGYSRQMVGSAAQYLDRIKSFASDGFTVGSNADVNKIGKVYYFTAFRAGGGKLVTGSYDGNGVAGRTIGGVGFTPEVVFVLPESANRASWRSVSFGSNQASAFGSDPTLANTITAFAVDGFVVGSDARANGSGKTYHYVAFEASADYMKVGSYTGNNVDNRDITGVGFSPEYMFIKSSGGNYATQKSSIMDATTTIEFTGSKSDDNRIHNLNPDGFRLGTQAQVNATPHTYYYVAFKGCGAPVVNTRMAGVNSTTASSNTTIEGLINPRNEIQNRLVVTPNPVRNVFNLKFISSKQETAKLSVTSFTGRVVLNSEIRVIQGENNIPVNVSNLAPGMYLVKLSWSGLTQSVRILISR
jgi:hypothetical protein